jgi:hypothetical protein
MARNKAKCNMRYRWLLFFFFTAQVHGQIADVDFHAHVFRTYESCVDFRKLKANDSITVVSSFNHKEMVARYKDNRLREIVYLDTLTGKAISWRLYTYNDSGLLRQIEQKQCYGFEDRHRKIKIPCAQIKTIFNKMYEYDSLCQLKKETYVHFTHSQFGFIPDSMFADFKYSPKRLEILEKEPYGRKVDIKFDNVGHVKSRVEYNRNLEVISEWSFDYEQKRKIEVTLNLHRDILDDMPILPTPRSFKLVVKCDMKGMPIELFDGRKTLHFKYY